MNAWKDILVIKISQRKITLHLLQGSFIGYLYQLDAPYHVGQVGNESPRKSVFINEFNQLDHYFRSSPDVFFPTIYRGIG